MTGVLTGLAVLLIGGLLGWLFLNDTGYVLVAWHQTSVEMSLSLALLLLLVAAASGVALLELVLGVFGVRRLFGRWLVSRRQARAWKLLSQGLSAFLREDYARAEKTLTKAAHITPEAFMAWWGAALAAQTQNSPQRAEQYLKLAEATAPRLPLQLARIRLWMKTGQWEAAAAALKSLFAHHRKEPAIAEWLLKALTHLQAWDELVEWLPRLGPLLGRDRAAVALADAHRQVLVWMGHTGNRVDRAGAMRRMKEYWSGLPRDLQARESVLLAYAEGMLSLGFDDEAETLVRKSMQEVWRSGLIGIYGRIRSSRPEEAKTLATGWLEKHPNHPALLLALGRINLQNRDWLSAKACFEHSLALSKNTECYAEYVRLLIQLNDPQAGHYLVAGLQQLTGRPLPNLPLPQEMS